MLRFPGLLRAACVAMTLLCLAAAAEARPIVFWASDPVGPDDTILMTGDGLQTVGSVTLRRLSDDPDAVTGKDAQTYTAEIVQRRANSLKVLVPAAMKPGVFGYRLSGSDGAVDGSVNAATVYWMQGDGGSSAAPGGWVRVFGRNIDRSSAAQIELEGPSARKRRIEATSGDLWSAKFPLPGDLPEGVYKLRLWNGNGDANTWRSVGTLVVRPSGFIPDHTESVTAFGAAGDGKTDDTKAIFSAIAAVEKHGGGTVLLPRGYYKLSLGIIMPDNVRLKGEGEALTSLVWGDSATPPRILIEGHSNFAVEDLTISIGRHFHIIRGGFPSDSAANDGENITIRRVRIRASAYLGRISIEDADNRFNTMRSFEPNGVDSIALAGRNLVVEDCDVVGSQRALLLLRPVNARIAGNAFSNGRGGWYSISGPNGVIFENNTIVGQDLQATGGGINSLLAGTAYSQNVLFQNNRLESFYGWDREAMTTDGPGGFYFGAVTATDGRVLTLAEEPAGIGLGRHPPDDWAGAGVFVLGGKGWGEFARLVSHEGRKVTIDREFSVPPDNSSVVAIVPMQTHYLIVGNTFADARVAVQLFGTSIEHVIADNTSMRTSGYIGRGMVYRHVQPSWYNQFLGNTVAEADPAAPSYLAVWGSQAEPSKEVLNYGSVVRGNRLLGNASIDLRGADVRAPGLSDIVVEHNAVAHAKIGIRMDKAVRNIIARANDFDDVEIHYGQ